MSKVITFGCRLNAYESESIKKITRDLKNTIIVNTCSVTKEAERQAQQAIRKIYRQNPDASIVVVGCAAQIHPDTYSKMQGVRKVLGNIEKLRLESYLTEEKVLVGDIASAKRNRVQLVSEFEGRARAFVEIQNGCNHRCTFCNIPYARGNNRSVPIDEIIEQVKILVDRGYKEVVFTGVDISDFGADLPGRPTLAQLVRRLLMLVPELPRLRLSSIDVAEIDQDLMNIIATECRLMPHLHLSLQSGNNLILKRMKRRHTREQVLDFCLKIRSLRPEIALGADVIAGFPTETETMFMDSYNLIKELNIVYLHVFPYSIREETPAARMPQVPNALKKDRVKKLLELCRQNKSSFYHSLIGSMQSIVVEKSDRGTAENFASVKLSQSAKIGSILNVKILDADCDGLAAELHIA
ncbi:threonylcarbamoyladenosine tRNA methylthiotransferase MtaB [Rickettsiales bacterium]|nr:threonylcarbamoyladenosine tRNA methylthiotransferase MtaB [Rickettsiales bacterium]